MKESFRQYLIEGERTGMRYALAVPHRVPLGAAGMHMGSRSGSSLEFKDHREYQPGDDLRGIDWSAYARSDKLIVKLYREEVSPHLDILIDASRSMALENSSKAQATLGLAAVLATAALNAGYSHGAWMAGIECQKVRNGTGRPSLWEGIDFTYRGNLADSLARLPHAWRRQGIRVLLSDLLWLGDPLLTLRHLAEAAAAVVVILVLAAADVDPPEPGNTRLVDSETEETRELFLDASAIKRYQDSLARHQQHWHLACKQAGAVMATVIAEKMIDDWQLKELVAAEILKVV